MIRDIPINDWHGFLSELSGKFNDGVSMLNTALEDALNELTKDPGNTANLQKYQAVLSEYTLYRNAQSNVVKVYKDVDAAIIANFR